MRHFCVGYAMLGALMLVALTGIAALVAMEVDSTLARREREAALLQVGHEFREALARYQAYKAGGQSGQYPQEMSELLLDRRHPRGLRHLRRLYPDPMTGRAEWGLVRQGGRIVGIYSLSIATPLKTDGFDPDDAAFRGVGRYRDWVFMHPADRVLMPQPAASAVQGTTSETERATATQR